jgi:hypothetical protein
MLFSKSNILANENHQLLSERQKPQPGPKNTWVFFRMSTKINLQNKEDLSNLTEVTLPLT